MLTLTIHHPLHHPTGVWLPASATLLAWALADKGPYRRGIAGRIAAWSWLAAGTAGTMALGGYLPAEGAAVIAAPLVLIAAPLTAAEIHVSRQYWRDARQGLPYKRYSRWLA
jgi:hypothetical protein